MKHPARASAPEVSRSDTDFDAALSHIADLLADARHWEGCGHARRAALLYALAERKALRSGFLELVRLVWAYADPVDAVGSRGGV